MTSRSRTAFIMSLVGLILLTGGFSCKRKTVVTNNAANTAATANVVATNQNVNTAANLNAAPADPNELTKRELGQLAMSFAERFGSYSNQNNYENIVDLKPFMSKKMQAWADKYVSAGRARPSDTSIYFGVTTRALNVDVKKFSPAGPVDLAVSTQRREATGTSSNAKVTYQNLAISFVKEEGVWRVDEAKWL